MKRVLGAIFAGALTVTALTACLSPQGASPAPAVDEVTIPAGVVATAELTSLDGVTTGSLVASYDGANIVIDFPGLTTGDAQILIVFADAELGPNDCFYDKYQVAFSWPIPDVPEAQPRFEPGMYSGDPSFFSTFAILEYPTGPNADAECWFTTLAIAPISWTFPDLRPNLTVEDAGANDGAHGAVTLDDDGGPLTYVTKAGDTLPQIAKRFGLSPDDLIYLNPCRPGIYQSELAYTDEVLNLSKERRGDRLPSDY